MRSPVAQLLGDLSAGLAEEGAAWYLFGARAAILHGVARLTADVDVTVRLPHRTSIEALAQTLERHGFVRRIADPAFVEQTRVMPFVHAATTMPLDVVLSGPGLEERFFERVIVREIDDIRVPVASAEDIIAMKVLAGRSKDVEDVVAILASSGGTLDEVYVRDTLTLVEQAIGQSDLLPVFEQALARARRRP
jgi:Nucleotidyl transferase AbiEii toxin, Type IV TA system